MACGKVIIIKCAFFAILLARIVITPYNGKQVCDVTIFADTDQEQPNSDKVVKMTSHPHDTMPGVQLVECTLEHSAESLREFNMMRDFRPSPDKPTMPEIRFL